MIGMPLKRKLAQKVYDNEPIGDTCTWPGTKWVGEGKKAGLLECGERVVGRGFFESPDDQYVEVHDLCERHARRDVNL